MCVCVCVAYRPSACRATDDSQLRLLPVVERLQAARPWMASGQRSSHRASTSRVRGTSSSGPWRVHQNIIHLTTWYQLITFYYYHHYLQWFRNGQLQWQREFAHIVVCKSPFAFQRTTHFYHILTWKGGGVIFGEKNNYKVRNKQKKNKLMSEKERRILVIVIRFAIAFKKVKIKSMT